MVFFDDDDENTNCKKEHSSGRKQEVKKSYDQQFLVNKPRYGSGIECMCVVHTVYK